MRDLKETLLKLRSMIDGRGATQGEKDNAKTLYERLLRKHGLTDEDMKPAVTEVCFFKYSTIYEKRLVHQIVAWVLGGTPLHFYTNRGKRTGSGFKLTAEQYDRALTFYEGLKGKLAEEVELCYAGFIQSNRLGVGEMDGNNLTPEEEAEIQKVLARAGLMDKVPISETRKGRLLGNGKDSNGR